VSRGYWNTPADRSSFGAQLGGHPQTYLRTGDLGMFDKQRLIVVGRLKDMMILDGRNVYPEDVEYTVANSHVALRDVRVAAFSVDGEASARLVVVIGLGTQTARSLDKDLAVREIRRALADEHELTPLDLRFVKLSTIPQTPSGKTQRWQCRARYLAGHYSGSQDEQVAAAEGAT
jgi:acyl-CoA synthetase (AMP-forming)/AMP-acid ligase II